MRLTLPPPTHPPPTRTLTTNPSPPYTTTLEKSPTPLKSKTTPFHAPLLTWSSQRSHFHLRNKLLVLPFSSLATSCWCTCQWRTAGSTLRALQLPGSNAARGRPAPSLFYSQPHYNPAPNSGRPFPVLFACFTSVLAYLKYFEVASSQWSSKVALRVTKKARINVLQPQFRDKRGCCRKVPGGPGTPSFQTPATLGRR